MTSSDMSIKLLTMFEAVYRLRNVSRAAEQLGVSQPSISIGLNKLRKHFNDPLFVRTSTGMEPTVHAQQVAQTVRRAMELLDTALGHQARFDPATAEAGFRVCMTDITQLVVLPRLLERFRTEAPGVRIEVVRFGPDTLRSLEAGDIDVLVGFVPDVGSGFYEQTLIKRDFSCICSAQHPRIRESLSLKQFLAEPHVVVRASGSGLQQAEQAIEAKRIVRRIMVQVPDFLGVETLVAHSDMLATVPRSVGTLLAERGGIRCLEHPVKLPGYAVKQHWHERFHQDPRNQWLRRLIADILGNKQPPAGGEAALIRA